MQDIAISVYKIWSYKDKLIKAEIMFGDTMNIGVFRTTSDEVFSMKDRRLLIHELAS